MSLLRAGHARTLFKGRVERKEVTAKQSKRKEDLGEDSHPKSLSGLAPRPQMGTEPPGSAAKLRLAACGGRVGPRLRLQ